ncbi:MAG: aminotransferase [Syntrophotaleaceae bacterium]
MKFPISPHMQQVPFRLFPEVQRWLADGDYSGTEPLIDLCQAVPDYGPPLELTAYLATLLDDPQTARYSPDEGLPEVREELCRYYRSRYGALIDPSRLCLTIGASQAFWLAMVVLCQAGDEVLVATPYYFDHVMGLQALGIRPVLLPFDEQGGGLPDRAAIAARITPRTKALLLVTPGNPAGTIVPPAELAELLGLARERNIALILDETYQAFIPEMARPHALFADPAWGDHFIHLASFGKTFALTGYRAGLLAASASFIHQALKVQDSMAVCAPRLTQQAIAFGVRHLDEWVADNCRMMQRRHDLFCRELEGHANPFRRVTSGAFFAWLRHPFAGRSGRQVSRQLLQQAGLLTLGGEIFGPGLEGYLRIAFGNLTEARIPEAVRRLRELSLD